MSAQLEKTVWQNKGGGAAGHHPMIVIGMSLLGLWSCGGLFTPLIFVLGDELTTDAILPTLMGLVWPALFLAIVIPVWILPRLRPMYFLTPTTLRARKTFGGERTIPLDGLQHVERKVVVYQGRYGPQEVITHRLVMQFANGRRDEAGPIADVDALIELLNDSVIMGHVDLAALPGVDGTPAAAEQRTDVFLASRSETGGMKYGPLFVGPTRLLRFTEVLEPSLLARLYTIVGNAIDGEEAEIRVVDFLRHPGTGHVLDAPRVTVKAKVERDVLYLNLAGREEEHVKLAPKDADRLRSFLRGR